MEGRFITLEGPEGAGKTLQAARLADALASRGRQVVLTREPGGTRLGERLREILLERAGATRPLRIDARTDAFLFNSARAQLVTEVVRPALEGRQVVVCARFADSTLAYQGYGAGQSLERLRRLAEIATDGLAPDRTVLLDVDPAIGLARKGDETRNRFESAFDLEFHRRVREGFLDLARREPDRWRVVDASRDVEAVFEDVLEAALSAL